MPVPTFDQYIDPLLRFLGRHPQGVRASEVHEALSEALGLSEGDKAELLPSGTQLVYKNRTGWAQDRLKRAGLSHCPSRGVWKLTQKGFDFILQHPTPLSASQVQDLAYGYDHVRLRESKQNSESTERFTASTETAALRSPDERLEDALEEIRRSRASRGDSELQPAFL